MIRTKKFHQNGKVTKRKRRTRLSGPKGKLTPSTHPLTASSRPYTPSSQDPCPHTYHNFQNTNLESEILRHFSHRNCPGPSKTCRGRSTYSTFIVKPVSSIVSKMYGVGLPTFIVWPVSSIVSKMYGVGLPSLLGQLAQFHFIHCCTS